MDMVEQFLTFPDERKEVLEMCLATPSTGDYKPIDLPSLETSALDPMMMSSYSNSVNPMLTSVSVRKHVPGKAGGGWESDDEDNVSVLALRNVALFIQLDSRAYDTISNFSAPMALPQMESR